MLSLMELRRTARLLVELLPGSSLRRVRQADDEQAVVLVFEGKAGKFQVLLSCSPRFARVSLAESADVNRRPSSFQEYLRAHLAGGFVTGIETSGKDRQIRLRFQSGSTSFSLILSILGARSNIYLLDAEGNLAHSLRPLDSTRSELNLGAPWIDPSGSLPSEGVDRWKETPDELYLKTVEKAYRRLEREYATELLARRIEQAVKKEKSFLDRKSVNLQEDLGNARQAEEYRRKGEMLKSVLHNIRPGDEWARAVDYQTGETVEIPLNPSRSPAANLESYFARYQKGTRGSAIIRQQLDGLATARSELEEIERRLREVTEDDMPDIAALEQIAAQPKIRRLISRYSPGVKAVPAQARPSSRKELPSGLAPKRYRTQDGLEVWVGKSDKGNDYLTTRLARGNDFFFHLEGYPGSHVILRTEGRSDPPQEAVLEACELAVHFSKLKNAGSADVHIAPVKNVKKPKGGKPGLVFVRKGRTIHLRRNPKRLEDILAGRLDN